MRRRTISTPMFGFQKRHDQILRARYGAGFAAGVGKKPHYTAEEVQCGRRVGSDMDYLPYACHVCTPDTFASQIPGRAKRTIDAMRHEVGSTFSEAILHSVRTR